MRKKPNVSFLRGPDTGPGSGPIMPPGDGAFRRIHVLLSLVAPGTPGELHAHRVEDLRFTFPQGANPALARIAIYQGAGMNGEILFLSRTTLRPSAKGTFVIDGPIAKAADQNLALGDTFALEIAGPAGSIGVTGVGSTRTISKTPRAKRAKATGR